ncbi:hypothetical protein [Micropruina sp.]|uniref:hypothetical protein n=1 Tax=Micropruina sp. TaxID=2737536 RepID=UPI0039E6C265
MAKFKLHYGSETFVVEGKSSLEVIQSFNGTGCVLLKTINRGDVAFLVGPGIPVHVTPVPPTTVIGGVR